MEAKIPRRDFLSHLGAGAALGLSCPLLAQAAATPENSVPSGSAAPADASATETALKQAKAENQFTNNWLTDLFDAIHAEVDAPTRVRLLEACGRACYRRHTFKQDIAAAGKGDVDKLVEAYRRSFRIRREAALVHISYGGGKCYCPAARNRPARPDDLHCECTRATHQAIWEAALGRPFRIELAETVRRGGQTCHLIVHLT